MVHSPLMHLLQLNWCLATSLILGLHSVRTPYFYWMSKNSLRNCYQMDLQKIKWRKIVQCLLVFFLETVVKLLKFITRKKLNPHNEVALIKSRIFNKRKQQGLIETGDLLQSKWIISFVREIRIFSIHFD